MFHVVAHCAHISVLLSGHCVVVALHIYFLIVIAQLIAAQCAICEIALVEVEGVAASAGHIEIYQIFTRATVLSDGGGVAVACDDGRLLCGACYLVVIARLRDCGGVVVAHLIYVDLVAIGQCRGPAQVGSDVVCCPPVMLLM